MSKFLNSRATSYWIARDADTPAFHELPRTEGNFARTYSTTTDETVVRQREAKANVKTGSDIAGDFSCNLRLSKHYELLRQGAMQSPASVVIELTDALTFAPATRILSGADFSQIKAGYYFKLTHADGSVVAWAETDGTATELLIGTITMPEKVTAFTSLKTSVMVTSDKQLPFFIQKRVAGVESNADKTYYRSFKGCEVFTWGVSMATEAIITESYNISGLELLGLEDNEITGQTDVDAKTYPLSDALGSVKGVQHIDFNNARYDQCFAQSFEFSLDNQGEATKALSTAGACALTYKDPVITGSASIFVLNSDPFKEEKLFDADATMPIAFTLFDQGQNKNMTISGRAKFTSLDTDTSGNSAIKNIGLGYEGLVYVFEM